MSSVKLTIAEFNALPAYMRKTEGCHRFVKSPQTESGWTPVKLFKK